MNIFKKGTDDVPYIALHKTDNEEQSGKGCGDVESEESELQLVVDIRARHWIRG